MVKAVSVYLMQGLKSVRNINLVGSNPTPPISLIKVNYKEII